MDYGDVVGTVALVLSAGSVGVQIWQWRRDGHRIAVKATQGFYASNSGDVSRDFLTIIEASNRGRGPVDVVGWGFKTPGGGSIVQTAPMPGASATPARLEAGQQAKWMMLTEDIEARCSQMGIAYTSLRPFVSLGDGTTVKGRPGIGLKPS